MVEAGTLCGGRETEGDVEEGKGGLEREGEGGGRLEWEGDCGRFW